jgi:tRNA(Ile)-lysidine synthase
MRNRVRHELLPALESYNPRFREAVWRAARTLAADHDLLVESLAPAWRAAVREQPGTYVAFDQQFLIAQVEALRMHLVRRAAELLRPGLDLGYDDLQRAAAFMADPAQEQTDFTGGLRLFREQGLLYLTTGIYGLPSSQWPQLQASTMEHRFAAPARIALAGGWEFSELRCGIEELTSREPWREAEPYSAYLDVRNLPDRLSLRARKRGDRIAPLGMGGHSRKLSDLFVDAKVPERARERWPVLCAGDEVIWVPGFAPAEAHRLRHDSNEVLLLRITRAQSPVGSAQG